MRLRNRTHCRSCALADTRAAIGGSDPGRKTLPADRSVLALALLVAQFGAEIHVYSHSLTDPVERQGAARSCGYCLASSQLQNAVGAPAAAMPARSLAWVTIVPEASAPSDSFRAFPGIPLPRTTRSRLKLNRPGRRVRPAVRFFRRGSRHVWFTSPLRHSWPLSSPCLRRRLAPMTMPRRCAPNSQTLKSDYDARVAALESRIGAARIRAAVARRRRRKPAPRRDCGRAAPRPSIPRSRSCSPATTPTRSRDPEDWAHRRLHAEWRRDRPRRAQLQPRRIRADACRQRRPVLLGAAHRRDHRRGRDRGRGGVLPHARPCPPASRPRAGASSPASATSTRCTRTPGTSRTSRSSTRRSSATSARRTACSSSGSRRRTSSSSSAPRPAMATHFPARGESGNGLNGTTLFAHVGGDIGDNASWRAGASWIDLRRRGPRATRTSTRSGQPVVNAFTGRSRTWVADAVFKWSPDGNSARRYLKVQGEYMHRDETGELAFDIENAALADAYRSTQSGWYLQGVYQFLPRWRAGLRYDALDSGTPAIGLVSSGTLPPADFPGAAAGRSEPHDGDGRLEPERVLALAAAIRLGRGARRRRDATDSSTCNTCSASARTAPTSTRSRNHEEPHSRRPGAAVTVPGAAGAGRRPRARDDGRLGRARDRARRRSRRCLHRDHGDAGRASRGCEAEPRRARAHGGPRRRERRRARGRLAAGAAAGIRQRADPARRPGLFRGDIGS